jgi:hypothetical protein
MDTPQEVRDYMERFKLKGSALKRHRKRVPIYDAARAKLAVKPNAGLETPCGDLPAELFELIAAHLHPRDVARMRIVSSGWRQAFWSEKVVRASLRGCGQLVNRALLFEMLRDFDAVLDACYDETGVCGKMCRWECVLGKTSWPDHVQQETHETITRLCLAAVPLGKQRANAVDFTNFNEMHGLWLLKARSY